MFKKIVYFYNIIRTKIIKYIWNKASENSVINGVCLVFHHISKEHINTLECCQCTPEAFINIIDKLQEKGYSIISIDDISNILIQQSTKKFAIITFDDVSKDMYENAYPILKKKKIPFTVFITTSFIDKKEFISKDQLLELNNDSLCTIGAHTITHPLLRFNSEKEKEIIDSGNILEKIIEKKVKFFAYPFGSFYSTDCYSINLANKRYQYSFSTVDSNLNDYTVHKTCFLPRRAISNAYELNE